MFTVVIDVIIARGSTKVVSNFYHSLGITEVVFQYQKLSNVVKIELLLAVADSQGDKDQFGIRKTASTCFMNFYYTVLHVLFIYNKTKVFKNEV